MGHSEASSAICSMIKAILTFENKKIAPIIHYKESRADCKALIDGRIKVVDKITDYDGKLIGVNSFGFGGEPH